jgi:GH15 family glucan-1,4-alpha-glucosidase
MLEKKSFKQVFFLLCILFLISCNHGRVPLYLHRPMEGYGPTDISGMVGNGRLSIGLNEKGTITVFKWPNPSHYDHIKYMTWSRERPFFGALPNEGSFAGIYYLTDEGHDFAWLREWEASQQYLYPDSLILLTRFESDRLKMSIEQTDIAGPEVDLFRRNFKVKLMRGSPVKKATLVLYSNFNPMVSKITSFPFQDTYLEYLSNSVIKYDPESDAIIQHKTGRDMSTGEARSVFIALGLNGPPDSFQVGLDSIARPLNPRFSDPFFQAKRGEFRGSDSAMGQVSAGLSREMDFSEKNSAEVDFFIALSDSRQGARDVLAKGREMPFHEVVERTRMHWGEMTASCPLPDTENQRILEVARLSLLVMLAGVDRASGSIVAGIATQSPYGEDWPRDGAFINEALTTAGFHDLVEQHNLFYIRHQAREDNPVFFRVPQGSWASNYYADGVPGMHVNFWQIDTTGFALWNLCYHFEQTGDREYLEQAYPAIKLTADFLTGFRDPKTGLQKKAHEFDLMERRQTIVGALSVHPGLRSAVLAAEEMGDRASLDRWKERADELGRILLNEFYSDELGCFTTLRAGDECGGSLQSWVLWPDPLIPYDDPRARAAADNIWQGIEPSIKLQRESGSYEIIPILALARAWKHDPEKLARVREALVWEAEMRTNRLGHFGEAWIKQGDRIVTGQAQPHVTHHALFYTAAIEAFGEK